MTSPFYFLSDTNSIHGDADDIYDPVTVADSEKIYDDIIKCSRESVSAIEIFI